MADVDPNEDADRSVEIWKIKKLIKNLTNARGFVMMMVVMMMMMMMMMMHCVCVLARVHPH